MNNIKVPYMPISDFKISEAFLEESEELDNEKPFFEPDSDSDCSTKDELREDLMLVLHGMGMQKYARLLKKHRVSLDTFLKLNDRDLKELGITDPEDIKTIVRKLGNTQSECDNEFIVEENHIEDLKIAKNVSRQVLLLQNYCSYILLQMKKNKMIDYKLESKELASVYLKAFTESALCQSRIMSTRLYDEYSDNDLIDKILKQYNLTLSPFHQKILPKKKRKGCSVLTKVVTLLGVSSLVVLIGKHLIKHL